MKQQNGKSPILTPFARMTLRRIAPYWLGLGLAGLALCVAFFVAHYIFKAPVYEAHTQRILKPTEFGIFMGIMVAGSAIFAVPGGLILRFIKKD